jgi:hydroxyacylglutathione hydrolase
MIEIVTIYTPAYKSNTYIIRDRTSRRAIIIDPTIFSLTEIFLFMDEKNSTPDMILPTHGHFDHIEGIDLLRNKFGCKVAANHECSIAFRNPKKNYSFYFENRNFSIEPPDVAIGSDNFHFSWQNSNIEIIKTPGHSPCSVCILIDGEILFTGDTILLEYSPFSKFPDGDAHTLKNSIRMIFSYLSPDVMVYPGHGKPFTLGSAIPKFTFLNQGIDCKARHES